VTSFDHLLLTRFAVRLDEGSPVPADEWLAGRLEVFKRFCAPSVNSQTNSDFTWLLLVDEGVPDWVVEQVSDAVTQSHEVVRLTSAWRPEAIGELLTAKSTSPWLITSRLDSDDALGRRYIDEVQQRFAEQPAPTFLNFLKGAQYVNGRMSTYAHPSNAFLSLIEPRVEQAAPRTVMSVSHDIAGRAADVIQVETSPLWLQVVHGGNLLNGSSGWRAQPSALLPHFGISEVLPDITRAALVASWGRDVLAIGGRIVARPSRLRWIPRYIAARMRRFRRRAKRG
jgi:hypothetical protein